jgi:hypothetical protein
MIRDGSPRGGFYFFNGIEFSCWKTARKTDHVWPAAKSEELLSNIVAGAKPLSLRRLRDLRPGSQNREFDSASAVRKKCRMQKMRAVLLDGIRLIKSG